jgi:acyl-CoA thioesterase I
MIWNKFIFIAVMVYCIVALAACSKKEITNAGSLGTGIVCFGDSITFGYGVNPSESYPSHLARLVNVPVINTGIDGDTTSEALKRIKSDVLSHNPFLVIIEFGGNDFLRKIPLDLTVKNVSKMIDLVQAHGAMVAIADISAGLLMKEYQAPYRKLARDKNTIFIPSIMSGIITNPKMKSDFLHPNEEGYKIISERIFRVIKPHLKQAIIRNIAVAKATEESNSSKK